MLFSRENLASPHPLEPRVWSSLHGGRVNMAEGEAQESEFKTDPQGMLMHTTVGELLSLLRPAMRLALLAWLKFTSPPLSWDVPSQIQLAWELSPGLLTSLPPPPALPPQPTLVPCSCCLSGHRDSSCSDIYISRSHFTIS